MGHNPCSTCPELVEGLRYDLRSQDGAPDSLTAFVLIEDEVGVEGL